MIRITVKQTANDLNRRDFMPWWVNFLDYCLDNDIPAESDENLSNALREWNAINIPLSLDIGFRNKKDLTFFLLRFL